MDDQETQQEFTERYTTCANALKGAFDAVCGGNNAAELEANKTNALVMVLCLHDLYFEMLDTFADRSEDPMHVARATMLGEMACTFTKIVMSDALKATARRQAEEN